MRDIEYVKSMHSNYERIRLEERPKEKRYEYMILGKNRIDGLLPFSMRYVNDESYLYYDITSLQNISQLYRKNHITREWIKDFVNSIAEVKKDLEKYLLDETQIIWNPNEIYQNLGEHVFKFLYVPYYAEDQSFKRLIEFLIERADYEDEALTEWLYQVYEQYENIGEIYLREKLFEDVMLLEASEKLKRERIIDEAEAERAAEELISSLEIAPPENKKKKRMPEKPGKRQKKGFFSFIAGEKEKDKLHRQRYIRNNDSILNPPLVAEEYNYIPDIVPESENTIYIEDIAEKKDLTRRLYAENGQVLYVLDEHSIVIGKNAGEADLTLTDGSVSRMHARIFMADGDYFIEDMNSTNGTFKNGIRLKPYEQRKLLPEDAIRLGAFEMEFR